MFLPIGDDVETRTLPFMAIVLIAINILLWVHTGTLWRESYEAEVKLRGRDHFKGFDRDGNPIIKHEPPPPGVKKADTEKWMNFIKTWGIAATDLEKGDYYKIMSHMFLHGDFFHLLGNMFVFWAFVGTLEATLGAWTTLFLYLFWGMVAAVVQSISTWGSDIPCIGASGAVAGVMGAYFLCFGALSRIKVLIWFGFGLPPRVYHIPASAFLMVWLFFQIWGGLEAQRAGISNVGWFAHIGGFFAGMFTMLIFKREVVGKLQMTKDGKLELKREEEQPSRRSAALPDVLPPLEEDAAEVPTAGAVLVPADATTQEAMPQDNIARDGTPRCQRCGAPFEEANRVMDQLFRCPKCKLLSDTSLPPAPPPSRSKFGSSRSRRPQQ